MKKIIPTKDFIVMQIPTQETSIALPDGVKVNRDMHFVAIAVGPEVKNIQVADRIVAFNQSILQVKLEGKEYYIVKEEFVIGVIAESGE